MQNAQTEAYDDIYVKNNSAVSSTSATTTVGQRVINAVLEHFGGTARTGSNTAELTATDTKGLVSVSITQASGTADAEITLATRDFTQEGTIAHDGGTLTWKKLEDNDGTTPAGVGDTPVESEEEYGLFDGEGNLIADWDTLTAAPYYLKVDRDYGWLNSVGIQNYDQYSSTGNSMYYVLNSYPQLSEAKTVKIPGNITSIGKINFDDTNKVSNIGEVKVEYCSSLTGMTPIKRNNVFLVDNRSVKLEKLSDIASTNKGVTRIGGCAFYGCENLENVIISEGIVEIRRTCI